MTKSDLIAAVAARFKLPVTVTEAIINDMFQSMVEALAKGERIELRGFGVFSVRDYEPYIGRNPKTGEQIQVEAKKLPYFKAGKAWQERLNKK